MSGQTLVEFKLKQRNMKVLCNIINNKAHYLLTETRDWAGFRLVEITKFSLQQLLYFQLSENEIISPLFIVPIQSLPLLNRMIILFLTDFELQYKSIAKFLSEMNAQIYIWHLLHNKICCCYQIEIFPHTETNQIQETGFTVPTSHDSPPLCFLSISDSNIIFSLVFSFKSDCNLIFPVSSKSVKSCVMVKYF